MSYFVKVIPPHGRARIHSGDCKFCRDGRGMENQDKGTGPTYWYPKHPKPGLLSIADAKVYMHELGPRSEDKGLCPYCMKGAS
jgi:hypothetical protein